MQPIDKRIVYVNPDGSIGVLCAAPGARLASSVTLAKGVVKVPTPEPVERVLRKWPSAASVEWAETEAEFLQRIAAKDVPKDAVSFRIVDVADLPAYRTFRSAWKDDGRGALTHDLEKCRELTKRMLGDAKHDNAIAVAQSVDALKALLSKGGR